MRRPVIILGHPREPARQIHRTVPLARRLVHWAACTLVTLVAACGGSPAGPSNPTYDPPSVTCPADVQVSSPPGEPAVVTFTPPAATNGAPPVTVSCAPGSGSSFDFGTSEVACTATDAQSRTATCSFTVIVTEIPQVSKVKFLAFGDSVTEGTISSPCASSQAFDTLWMKLAVVAPESYPYKLQAMLAARYTSQTVTVTNEGKAGERVSLGLDRLKDVLAAERPEVLLLLDGFNDLRTAGQQGTFDSEIPRVAGVLEEMVKAGQARNAVVLLATMPALDASGCRGQGAPGVTDMNKAIRHVAADEGATLVDLYGALGGTPAGVIGIDGLHPTADGYTKLAEVWFDVIRQRLERPSASAAGGPVLVVEPADRIR